MNRLATLAATVLVFAPLPVRAAESQWGGSPSRNNVSTATNLPERWDVGTLDERTREWSPQGTSNVRWVARLGTHSYGSPLVVDGKVLCATNNGAGYLPQFPPKLDLGCLVCCGQADGGFLWQYSAKKLGRNAVDFAEQGICCVPLVEDGRVWLVTNRCEVVCLELTPAGQSHEPRVLWSFDMIGRLGVVPHNMSSCSVTAAGDLLLVVTANGVDDVRHDHVVAPRAPSFLALEKRSGKLVWADNSPGSNILHGQWGSPAYAVLDGVPQAVFPGGDGWLYSFRAARTADGKPELLWKFDCNPKTSVWRMEGGTRGTLVATPVIDGGHIYIATGDDPELGDGPGHLWCIDPRGRGDVSPELAADKQGRPLPPRRLQAADPAAGDVVRANPHSAAVWHYQGTTVEGQDDAPPPLHHTLGMAVIHDGLLVLADLSGVVHCLDAKTGKLHWTCDLLSRVWGTPLVADGKIFIGDEDGEVAVLAAAPALKVLAKNKVGRPVFSTPTAVGHTLYIATERHLLAIEKTEK
jgi:outer membrane protein assembly factor BamB